MNSRDKKNIIIVFLLTAVVFMSAGYALLSAEIDISGSSQIVDPHWDVKITSISSTETEGTGESIEATVQNNFSAKFKAKFKAPGDRVTYVVNVKNGGTIDAKLNSISISPENYNEGFIVYSIEGIEAGNSLQVGESKMFTITATYNKDKEGTPKASDLTKDITLVLDFVQK